MGLSVGLFHRSSDDGIDSLYKQIVDDIRMSRSVILTTPMMIDLQRQIHERPWLYGVPINVNVAGAQSLMDLPGIGRTISNRIIAYRELNGNFANETELDNVKGIGPATLTKIRPHISFK